MSHGLPAWLSAAIAARLEGVSRQKLAIASSAITEAYRSGAGSKTHVTDDLRVAAYLAARLPATYAAVSAALERLIEHAPDFAPESVLDIGAGPGTASFAAVDALPSLMRSILRDHNRSFLDIARELTAASPIEALRDADIGEAELTARGALPRADLLIAAYMLVEVAEVALPSLVERFWQSSNEVLLLVEPGTPEGFRRIRLAREWLLEAGAHILAPCTHALTCPMIGEDWCHFSVRLPRSRDHRAIKQADVPFEDERFCYLAVSRQLAAVTADARILAPPHESKPGIAFKLCRDGKVEERFVPTRDKADYRAVRQLGWGDAV